MKTLVSIVVLSLGARFLTGQTSISLLENSPFMPPGKAETAQPGADLGPPSLAKLQLRGITSLNGEYIFSVYNPDTRESKWIAEGKSEDGLVIKSYDPGKNAVVIHSESENHSRQLEMNDYAASSAIRPPPIPQPRDAVLQQPMATPLPQPVSPTGTLIRTQQEIQRPTRRNLETLRERREELAEKLRKQPTPGNPPPGNGEGNNGPNNGGNR